MRWGLEKFLCKNEVKWDDARKGGADNVSNKKEER